VCASCFPFVLAIAEYVKSGCQSACTNGQGQDLLAGEQATALNHFAGSMTDLEHYGKR